MTTGPNPHDGQCDSGFTLVELLVVLAIIGMVAALGASFALSQRSSTTADLQGHALRVAAGLRAARATAIRQGREVAFHFDAQKNTWSSGQRARPTELPKGMILKLDTARQAIIDETDARLVFFHDGSSTGGRISLSYGATQMIISVAWINGAVSVDQHRD